MSDSIALEASDSITGREAAQILNLSYPGQFNNARRRLQRALTVRGTHAVIWVVDVWGGVKYPGSEWRYSRRKCSAAAAGDL